MNDRLDALADRLEAISEEIADTAIDELKAALARRDGSARDKELNKARRAVDKAANLLRSAAAGQEVGGGRSDTFD